MFVAVAVSGIQENKRPDIAQQWYGGITGPVKFRLTTGEPQHC